MSLQRFVVAVLALCLLCALPARAEDDGSGPIPALTTQNFAATVKAAERPVLIEFKARWCPYCKKEQPLLEAMRLAKMGQLDIYQVDVDDEPDIAADYDAHVLPTLVILYHGDMMGRSEGALYGSDLSDWVKDVESDVKAKQHSNESDSTQAL